MTYSIFVSSRPLQNYLELLGAIALLVAFFRPSFGARAFRRLEAFLTAISRSPWRGILAAALFPLVVRLLLLPAFPLPTPRIHDEFSYLLLADTLAHGRVANPTPPSPQHFETEYELMLPTYASQYQPGQGVFLAAGQLLAGHPWWGVWLSIGFMCGALFWALAGFLPSRWAMFGAVAAALQFGIYGFWMNAYFGGAVTAIGGALVFGSLARGRYPALCALGLIVLFATRPVEAILWTLAALVLCPWNRFSLRATVAFTIVFSGGVLALADYNCQITGNLLDPPYAAYRRQYGVPQSYWWQPAVSIASFRNPQLRANYADQLEHWRQRSSAAALWNSTWRRTRDFWRFFIGPLFTPALLFAGLLFRRRGLRVWLWVSLAFILDHATYHAWYPQQSGSETVLIVLMLVECWRMLRVWRHSRGYGPAISRFLIVAFAVAILSIGAGRAFEDRLPSDVRKIWGSLVPPPAPREDVIRRLESLPGRHLVFVHYGPQHHWYDEWVFNGADIPNARVVFARICSPAEDRELIAEMSDRQVWVADPDRNSLVRH